MNDNRHVCLTVCVFFSHLREAASGYRKRGGLRPQKVQPTNPQLFDDTSTQPPLAYSQPPPHVAESDVPQPTTYDPSGMGYPQQPAYDTQPTMSFPGQPQFMADPVANMAVQYGQTLAGQGKEYVHKNVGNTVEYSSC
ncbi:hypothetical protein LSH36_1g23007 [Paralvinella palmiformis]|uniref:Uncharacterized protein n=1 Tax=Paralvinella palmiformis TaxID=53620 RepID=A0AAD9NJM0_9ANNE|nr:hypothetical protein LSH36_1g23007 [Paralvinella palmiformis]